MLLLMVIKCAWALCNGWAFKPPTRCTSHVVWSLVVILHFCRAILHVLTRLLVLCDAWIVFLFFLKQFRALMWLCVFRTPAYHAQDLGSIPAGTPEFYYLHHLEFFAHNEHTPTPEFLRHGLFNAVTLKNSNMHLFHLWPAQSFFLKQTNLNSAQSTGQYRKRSVVANSLLSYVAE